MANESEAVRVRLRPMHMADIPQVVEIDRLCFPIPWPASSYRFELNDSRNSSMFTIAAAGSKANSNGSRLRDLWQRMVYGQPDEPVVAYAGCWHMRGESHISTIGVHPHWRGLRIGELLMFGILRNALAMGAEKVTLEVRVSNEVAINLYHKYGFKIISRRPEYYRDNREDAWLMLVACDARYADFLDGLAAELFEELDVIDAWPR